MKEIGGYFELEQLISNEYYNDLIPLNNGRSALLYIIKAKKIKKLYIPYYLCNSVSHMLKRNDYDFEYYRVDSEFIPIFNISLANNEYLYVINYYGQLGNHIITNLKQKYKRVIVDNTHAFFQKPIENMDTIYTCRKFFGVPDGAYLSTDAMLKDDLEVDISKNRMTHILGRYEGMASDYYIDFQNNDEAFKRQTLKCMSKLTHNILGAIDYEKVRQIRNENYTYLECKLGGYNKLKIIPYDGAFAYPLYVKNSIEVRREMAKKKIYIPMLWPNVVDHASEYALEHDYATNILPLPCDQRYGLSDMETIVKALIEYIKYIC
jgi:hypothetical protein